MTYDCVIVGAGIAGLTTSAILAKNGMRVALVEKAPVTAPIIRGFSRKGLSFDTGFHYTGGLESGGALDVLLGYLHMQEDLQKIPFDPEGFDVFHVSEDGFEFRFPYGEDRILASLEERFPDDRPAIRTYLEAVRRVYESLPYTNLDAPLTEYAAVDRTTSLKGFLDSLTHNALLRGILSMHCLLHGTAPEDVPFALHACVVGAYFKSVNRIQGGGKSLAQAFDARLSSWGVDVLTGRGAREITFSDSGSLTGICLDDGEHLSAARCVVAVHPRQFMQLLPEHHVRPAYRKRLMGFEDSMSAYVLYAMSGGIPEPLRNSNYFLLTQPGCLGLDPGIPVQSRPVYLVAAGEDGRREHAFMVLCPADASEMDQWHESRTGRRPEDYKARKAWIAQQLLKRIAQKFPELPENVSFAECATPLTFRDFGNSPFGSLYGIKHKVDQFDPVPITRVKQLFLAGQAVAAPGILGAMISAFLACGTILGHEHLRDELRKYR